MTDPARVWVQDRDWDLLPPEDERFCRMPKCGKAAVAVLHRYSHAWDRTFPWAYCEDHLYGRRIEGDRVLHEVSADSPAAERGWLSIQQGRPALKYSR